MSIQAIIVDDESGARDVLVELIERSNSDISVIATAKNVPEAANLIATLKPQVIFLDIQMPKYSGFELSNFVDLSGIEIVFVTAYDEYAIKAFELSAIDYLVKPVNRKRLAQTIERLSSRIQQNKLIDDYQVLFESMEKRTFRKIVIPELGNRRVFELDDIAAIKADGVYSNLLFTDGNTFTTSKGLTYFEQLLSDESSIARIHKSWMVNLKHVLLYQKSRRVAQLKGGWEVKISKLKLQEFEELLQPG